MRHLGRTSAVIAALVLALAAVGCGGEDSSGGVPRLGGGTTTSGKGQQASRDFEDAALDYAECMRENGVDMPDPQGGRFEITPESGGPAEMNAPKFRKADGECRKHLANAKPPQISEEDKEAFQEASLEHARCMREHGIEMPDPTAQEGGGMAVPLDGLDLNDPEFKKAQKACEGKLRGLMGGGGS